MNLVEQIIAELVNSDQSLTNPLLKTKVLASRIGNKELLEWVNKELTGYDSSLDTIPPYRVIAVSFFCTLRQGSTLEEDIPLPLMLFDKAFIERLLKFRCKESIKILEVQSTGNAKGKYIKDYPPDMCLTLTSKIKDNTIEVVKLRMIINSSQFAGVVAAIRSKLLDFMLKIEEELPNLDVLLKEKMSVKEKVQETVEKLVHQTIINAGDGNTITTGKKSKVQTKTKIIKGNIDALQKELKKNNVSEEDANELTTIVAQEQPDLLTGELGPKVKGWVGKMLQKSINGTWDISIATAGGLLVELIKAYYGLS